MKSLAAEYREKVNNGGVPEKYLAARESFWEYNKLINPKFFREDRWHLKLLAETLQALFERRIIREPEEKDWRIVSREEKGQLDRDNAGYAVCRNLIVNIPPRHGKSYNLSQFCDWVLGKDNEQKIIAITYNDILAGRFSVNVRDGIEAEKADKRFTVFHDIFPETKIKYGDSAKGMWSLEGQYFTYLGTGFGGTITGVGASIIIIDDPVKNHLEAFNDDVLDAQYQWYTDTILSRLEEDGIQIVNMTRWNSRDLAGRLTTDEDAADWHVLELKACLNEETGEMLCPSLLSWDTFQKKKKKMTLAIFLANYQQMPVDLHGALYKKFREYETVPADKDGNPLFEQIKAYCDTADEGADFLCNIIYGVYNMEAYVLNIIYTDKDMGKTEEDVAKDYYTYNVDWADIESNNGGRGFARSVGRILKEKYGTNHTHIESFYQGANKIARIKSNATWVQEHIYYPAGWQNRFPEYFMAMKTFQSDKKNKHDDAPDATTGIAEKMQQGADNWLY